ncbi:P-loop containing nucleoside triphosphate hydrolase protein, partial [Mycena rosella]
PPSPKIFHGRDSELNDLIGNLLKDSARVAVLGPGGMGKTTLAMAVLHHPDVIEKYNTQHFISCESANTSVDLASILGAHLGLERSNQLKQAVVRYFEASGPSLLILDNLETPWEPVEGRGEVEELLSLLADIPTLALLITMRGAERPAKVKWTRPFLPTLEPLSPSASGQIFSDVADEPEIGEQSVLDELIVLSDNLPLAVSLMASIASFEGYTSTLSRWKGESTTLVSDGHDKRSNLEISITLSLESPRISPDARNLLSLLSILPDGITDEDIIVSKILIPDIAHCRTSLLRTSLGHVDVHGRLKALSPIREFIRRVHPPSVSLSKPLRTHLQDLLMVWRSHRQLPLGYLVPRLLANLGNFNELILQGLADDQAAWPDIGHTIIILNSFSNIMGKGTNQLNQKLPNLIEATGEPRLRWKYASARLNGNIPGIDRTDAECLITDGLHHFHTVQSHIYDGILFHPTDIPLS